MSDWKEVLQKQLDEATPADQYILTSEWIYFISQTLLPELGRRRRQAPLLALKANPEMDATEFAEKVGASPNTIKRLLGDARAEHRRHLRAA